MLKIKIIPILAVLVFLSFLSARPVNAATCELEFNPTLIELGEETTISWEVIGDVTEALFNCDQAGIGSPAVDVTEIIQENPSSELPGWIPTKIGTEKCRMYLNGSGAPNCQSNTLTITDPSQNPLCGSLDQDIILYGYSFSSYLVGELCPVGETILYKHGGDTTGRNSDDWCGMYLWSCTGSTTGKYDCKAFSQGKCGSVSDTTVANGSLNEDSPNLCGNDDAGDFKNTGTAYTWKCGLDDCDTRSETSGIVTCSASISGGGTTPNIECSFTPESITAGGSTVLSYAATGGIAKVTITGTGIFEQNEADLPALSSSKSTVVNTVGSGSAIFKGYNSAGSVVDSCEAPLTVTAGGTAPAATVSVSASPSSVEPGDISYITWTHQNASRMEVECTGPMPILRGGIQTTSVAWQADAAVAGFYNPPAGTPDGFPATFATASSTPEICTFYPYGSDGKLGTSDSVSITISGGTSVQPYLSCSFNPTSVDLNEETTLKWEARGVASLKFSCEGLYDVESTYLTDFSGSVPGISFDEKGSESCHFYAYHASGIKEASCNAFLQVGKVVVEPVCGNGSLDDGEDCEVNSPFSPFTPINCPSGQTCDDQCQCVACTANCTCETSTCVGSTCSDGCGGTCAGKKTDGVCATSGCGSQANQIVTYGSLNATSPNLCIAGSSAVSGFRNWCGLYDWHCGSSTAWCNAYQQGTCGSVHNTTVTDGSLSASDGKEYCQGTANTKPSELTKNSTGTAYTWKCGKDGCGSERSETQGVVSCQAAISSGTATCSPTTPPTGKTACPGTQTTGLSAATPWTDKGTLASCSATGGKCEYYTPATSYSCTGTLPTGSTKCEGDDTGLTANIAWQSVGTSASSCTTARKCEYYAGSSCAWSLALSTNPASGQAPLTVNLTATTQQVGSETYLYTNQSCGSGGPTPTNIDGASFACVYPSAGTYYPSIKATAQSTSCVNNATTTVTVSGGSPACAGETCKGNSCWDGQKYISGTKTVDCATVSATANPSSLTVPGTTYLKWSTIGGSKMEAACLSGPIITERDSWFLSDATCKNFGLRNGCTENGYAFAFGSNQTGKEICTFYPYNSSDGKPGIPTLVEINANAYSVNCGTAARTYAATETGWGSYTFCSAGTAEPTNPTFPATGGSTTWTCKGENGGTDSSCKATRSASVAINGVCGTAKRNYAATETGWGSYAFCSAGTANPTSPIFPAQGGSTTWTCEGVSGGTNASCRATRSSGTPEETGWALQIKARPALGNPPLTVVLSPFWTRLDPNVFTTARMVELDCGAEGVEPITDYYVLRCTYSEVGVYYPSITYESNAGDRKTVSTIVEVTNAPIDDDCSWGVDFKVDPELTRYAVGQTITASLNVYSGGFSVDDFELSNQSCGSTSVEPVITGNTSFTCTYDKNGAYFIFATAKKENGCANDVWPYSVLINGS
jgi:hypothetical protein